MTTQPNVVVIIADQLRADALGAFGSVQAKTPNIDALAERGTKFTNCFVQHTVCSPSRASFLTGWYPHVRGHRSLTHLLRPDDPNLLKSFKNNGYHVTHVGERGDTFAPGATEASCDEYGWSTPPAHGLISRKGAMHPDWPLSRAFYIGRIDDEFEDDFDEACTRTAVDWLAQAPADKPWLLYVPLVFPHCPFAVTEPWYSLHDRASIAPRRPGVQSGHEPSFMQHVRDTYGTDRLSDEDWREIAGVYHGMVSRFDSQVGRIVEAVGTSLGDPDLDNTVVMLFSDHGEYLGDYDLIEKWPSGMNDCLARTPLIMAGPSIPATAEVDDMVELLDIVPTLYELANIEPDYTHFGKSLVPTVRDSDSDRPPHRRFAFTEGGFLRQEEHLLETPGFPYDLKGKAEHDRPETVGKAVAVRSADWTYVWRLYEPPELYDRATDPDEIHNLAGKPEHAAVEAELGAELLRWMVETGDVMPWSEDPRFPTIELPVPAGAPSAEKSPTGES
jgi:arylsulfatase A-like enzyme